MDKPILVKGCDPNNYPKLAQVWPRAYHKYLRKQNMENIYGQDVVDEVESNVVSIEVEPLNTAQEQYIEEISEPVVEEPVVINEPVIIETAEEDEA